MANPNIVNVTDIRGKTAVVDLSTTNATLVVENTAALSDLKAAHEEIEETHHYNDLLREQLEQSRQKTKARWMQERQNRPLQSSRDMPAE